LVLLSSTLVASENNEIWGVKPGEEYSIRYDFQGGLEV